MKRLLTVLSGSLGWLAAGSAAAHPGHGLAGSNTPGHALDHAAEWLMSPWAWLLLAMVGLLALRRLALAASKA